MLSFMNDVPNKNLFDFNRTFKDFFVLCINAHLKEETKRDLSFGITLFHWC